MGHGLHHLDTGQRRSLVAQGPQERLRRHRGDADQHALGIVQDLASQRHLLREFPHEGSIPHTLHLSPDTDRSTGFLHDPLPWRQCTVQTMQGSKLRTICCTLSGVSSPSDTGAPTSAASSAPGVPALSRGEKFQVVGATI